MKLKHLMALLLISLFLGSCASLPEKKLYQFSYSRTYDMIGDTLRISISNPLMCPLVVNIETDNSEVKKIIDTDFPLTMAEDSDTTFNYLISEKANEVKLSFKSRFGSRPENTVAPLFSLPFSTNKTYKIIQGYDGSFSHNSDFSRYALDFSLQENDTICAAADGFVVGVIEGYSEGGESKKWRDYANFITLYHPNSNLYSQYVHLPFNGSFVELGDEVMGGEPIGLAGTTGFTTVEHLHFNVLKPQNGALFSSPIDFENGMKGSGLQKGTQVTK